MDQKVTLIDKKSHQGIEVNASDKIQLSAQSPSVVQLKISSEDIKEYRKEGNNLVVVLKSGELITIMGFFDADNSLVLQDDINHKLLWVEFSSNGEALSATYAELNDVGPLLYGESDATSPWAWAAVPLVAGGILAWAGHDSGNDSENGTGETNEGPSAPESVVIGNGDEWITADEIDADGKVDVTIDLPADAVAGDSVIVNGEETVLTADDIAAGEIIVKVDAPNEGETLEVDVIIKDKDGNESDPTQAEATVDTTAPSAPDSVIIGNGDEWISADEIDADGKVDVKIDLPVDAIAGDSVIVNGEETVLTADDIAAGEIIVKVDAPNEGETLEVEVSIKDAAGNESGEVLAEAMVDTTAPSAPTLVEIGNGDDKITAGEVAAGEVEVKVGLPTIGIAVGDIVDVNGVEYILTQADLEAGEVIVKVPMNAAENEDFTATATIKDTAGNESTPLVDSAVVDVLGGPSAPDSATIGNGDEWISANEIDIDGKVDVKIDLSADAVADDSVIVNGEETVLTADDIAAGEITVKVDAPNEGETLEVEVSIKDAAGNESDTIQAEASVDSVLPIIEIETVTPIDSEDPADGIADRMTITGRSDEANAPVVIKDKNGNTIWEGETDDTGAFSATVDTALVQAGDNVTVEVTDKAGNTGTDTAAAGDLTFSNDNTAPTGLTAKLLNDTGLSAIDGITKDGTLTIGGVESGAKWSYSTDGGTTWIEGTGNSVVLPVGVYTSVQVKQTDIAGNDSTPVNLGAVTVDTSAPTGLTAKLLNDTGLSAIDGITKDGTLTIGGVESGAKWSYSTDGGTTWIEGTGNSVVLPVGVYTSVQVKQTDIAGNDSTPVNLGAVTVDTSAPTGLTAKLLNDTGLSTIDGITKDGTLTIGGVESGAKWSYSTDGGTTWIEGTGNSVVLPVGVYTSVQVKQTDIAGNDSTPVNLGAVTVDTSAPTGLTAKLLNDTGLSTIDGITKDGTLTIGGVESGAKWSYSTDGGTTWIEGTGNSVVLPVGVYTSVQVKQTDIAGNDSTPVNLGAVTVDTSAPTGLTAKLLNDTGLSTIDGITKDGTLTIGGVESGAKWSYSTDGGTTWIEGTGNSVVLPVGVYTSVQVKQTDIAGNDSTPVNLGAVTVDTSAPTGLTAKLLNDTGLSTIDGITKDGTLTIGGVESGAKWSYSTDGGTTWIEGTGNSVVLPVGVYTSVQVKQTDIAGNDSTPVNLGAVTVDTSAPTGLTAKLLNDTGLSAIDGITKDGTLTIGGVESGAKWSYSTDGGTTWIEGTGNSVVLPVGVYTSVQVKQTDIAGNDSTPVNLGAVTVDTSAPIVDINNGALLGIIGTDVAGLLVLEQKPILAVDPNNNLTSVKINFNSGIIGLDLLGLIGTLLGGGGVNFKYSTQMATEFGFNIVLDALSGLSLGGSDNMSITITKQDGGTIDNLQMMEFLQTIHADKSLLGLNVGSKTTITAVDQAGNVGEGSLNALLGLNVLEGLLGGGSTPSYIVEGTNSANTLGNALLTTSQHIYGYGGDDHLTGGKANDLLRGGDGNDILQGNEGNDYLSGGAGSDTAIYYLLNNVDATGGNGTDTWIDFELGAGADKINISALLDGLQTSANIGDYISVETNADGKAVISIDRDGASNGFSASDLLVLDNISPADLNLTNEQLLNNLLSNNQIVY